jgi:VIT1/CCC1 family predicted Fe2+/Mn2+ transporter
MEELQHIYEERGLPAELAKEVAMHLTKNDAVLAHARDELNIDPDELANPGQARCAACPHVVHGVAATHRL